MEPYEKKSCGYYELTVDWMREMPVGDIAGPSVQSFDFGGETEFRSPGSVEPWIHPYLTAYRKKPEDGFIASIPLGKLWGHSGAVLTPDGMLLGDVSREYDDVMNDMTTTERHPIFQQRDHTALEFVRGTTAALAFCGGYNYFHWMYDVMARWGMLVETGIAYDRVVVKANPYGTFARQTLAMLGLSDEKVIRTHPNLFLQAERLIVPSLMMSSHYPQWATLMLRKLFLPHQAVNMPVQERIFISRNRASYRRMVNEDAVKDVLSSLGFSIVILEDLSVAEQIALFVSARVVVAPHGAGLTNLAFCQPGTKVVEIFHPGHIVPVYWMISNHNELDYYLMYGQSQKVEGVYFAGLENIQVDIGTLVKTLELAGIV
ncbi:glycosyltransferase family 61 protein [Paenibacillus sp. GCM10028914]|uniref:glycosyltransferase family 61 protein n=1 Tax=Paenibacillus sp. GCM10028914 TaxID=3273416 RepID=UPI00361A5F2B